MDVLILIFRPSYCDPIEQSGILGKKKLRRCSRKQINAVIYDLNYQSLKTSLDGEIRQLVFLSCHDWHNQPFFVEAWSRN